MDKQPVGPGEAVRIDESGNARDVPREQERRAGNVAVELA
jgi:hypothetical protein